MATQNKITEMIAAIKTIYPYYAKDANVQILVKTWSVLLKDFPDNITEAAFYKCLQTCKMPPTPADVIENINELINSTQPTAIELWNELADTLRKAGRLKYYFSFNALEPNGLTQGQNAQREVQSLWDNLDECVKQYIGGYNEFLRLARGYDEEELKYERNRFIKTIPTIQKRKTYADLLIKIENGEQHLLGGCNL